MLYVFFWVIPRRLNFICRRFGTLCLFHLYRQVGELFTYLPMKMEETECSETSAYKIQTSGNYSEENIQQDMNPHLHRIKCVQLSYFIHSFNSLSYNRSKASSKVSSPHSAIQSFLVQIRVSSPFLKT